MLTFQPTYFLFSQLNGYENITEIKLDKSYINNFLEPVNFSCYTPETECLRSKPSVNSHSVVSTTDLRSPCSSLRGIVCLQNNPLYPQWICTHKVLPTLWPSAFFPFPLHVAFLLLHLSPQMPQHQQSSWPE